MGMIRGGFLASGSGEHSAGELGVLVGVLLLLTSLLLLTEFEILATSAGEYMSELLTAIFG